MQTRSKEQLRLPVVGASKTEAMVQRLLQQISHLPAQAIVRIDDAIRPRVSEARAVLAETEDCDGSY